MGIGHLGISTIILIPAHGDEQHCTLLYKLLPFFIGDCSVWCAGIRLWFIFLVSTRQRHIDTYDESSCFGELIFARRELLGDIDETRKIWHFASELLYAPQPSACFALVIGVYVG